jgi:bifunctional non-homologous end joining protein LigD
MATKSTRAAKPPELEGPLKKYWAKRDFAVTSEPRGEDRLNADGWSYVIQKHAARQLHYDFRLELGGVLLSWALPKGPSVDPADKRIAVHVEDHPLSYGSFEGTIPPKQYGAGTVIVWDNGNWEPIGDPKESLAKGKLIFVLHGQKLKGRWELVRIAKPGEKQELWILFKKRGDAYAKPKSEYDVVRALPDSVIAKPLRAKLSSVQGERGSSMPGAKKATLPQKIGPQLATAAKGVPATGEWSYEIKFDGYRIGCRIEDGHISLITRGGHDWSERMPKLVHEIAQLGLKSSWLDGEIVVLGDDGLPSFNQLQKVIDRPSSKADIDYFLFDVPHFEGYDLRGVALSERRRLLKALLDDKGTQHVRYSAEFHGSAATVLESARKLKLEGVMAKREDALYVSRRTETWLKLKCRLRQEFVVCGYTDRSDGSREVGSLLLGLYSDDGELVSVGGVGTGWDAKEAQALKTKLSKIEVSVSPFASTNVTPGRWSKRMPGSEHWLKPKLVAEVEYGEVTPDGQIRHAVYLAMRTDKAATSIRREAVVGLGAGNSVGSASTLRVTHGERVIDKMTGLTKLDLVRYYESVAEFMLPHLRRRPCSLVRGPQGVDGKLFFQKHGERTVIPGLKTMDPTLWPDHEALLEVPCAQAISAAAQMNVIEFHTWNSTDKNINKPDRIIFDLDPGEGTPWQQVQEAALLLRGLLQELGLESWLKTSGGKGLHVVVPITPKLDYATVGAFSKAVVKHIAGVIPSRFVAKSGPTNRARKIFVDYLRNAHGATTAAAFSARARPGLGVSMPIAWDDLARLKSGSHWTIATAREHLSFQAADPWANYWKKHQSLNLALKILG